MEEQDDHDGTLLHAVRDRLSEIAAERERTTTRLAAASEPLVRRDDVLDLLHALGDPDPDELRQGPETLLRQVFDAFRLSIIYDGRSGKALCRAVVSDDTLPAIQDALAGIQRGAAQ